ncbi:hypothetical protein EDB84DRAFT_1676683 [Lactarius hengduanensis]|nr:hypothetical protein EDB84DRAFT_1676683 [Lactarius hengduanensis]
MVSSSPLRFLRFSSPRTELVLPFWPDGDDGDESFCPRWVTTANRGERLKVLSTSTGFGFVSEPHDSETQQNGTSERLLSKHLGLSSKDETRTYVVAPSKVEGEGRIIRHWPRFATNLVQAIARGLSSVLTDRVCFFSHCGTTTTVWQTQDDLLNPERRAALSAGWACLEWSGTSGTAAQPGRGRKARNCGAAFVRIETKIVEAQGCRHRRYGRVPDKRLAGCIVRSSPPARSAMCGGRIERRPSTPWGKRGYSSRKLHDVAKMEKDRQGPFPHGNEKGLFPQSARVYSATDGDEKTTHFYQENTGFETNKAQIMCLLEEGHEQWTTRILDVMLRLGSALLQPNVSDEGSRGGNAPYHGNRACVHHDALDAVGASSAGAQNDVILGWRGSRDQALQGTSGVQSPIPLERSCDRNDACATGASEALSENHFRKLTLSDGMGNLALTPNRSYLGPPRFADAGQTGHSWVRPSKPPHFPSDHSSRWNSRKNVRSGANLIEEKKDDIWGEHTNGLAPHFNEGFDDRNH